MGYELSCFFHRPKRQAFSEDGQPVKHIGRS